MIESSAADTTQVYDKYCRKGVEDSVRFRLPYMRKQQPSSLVKRPDIGRRDILQSILNGNSTIDWPLLMYGIRRWNCSRKVG